MRDVDYTAEDGRIWRVRVPDDCPADMISAGIPVGPPDLDSRLAERGWPLETRIRLHNELHTRGLLTLKDVLRRPADLEGTLKSVLRTDMQTLQTWYYEDHGGK